VTGAVWFCLARPVFQLRIDAPDCKELQLLGKNLLTGFGAM
jgi:hypothetical protein